MAARDQSHLAVLAVWKRLGPCLTLITSEALSPNTAKHSRESGPPARQLREDATIQFVTARGGDFLPGAGSTLSSARVTGFLGGSNDTDAKKFYKLLGTVQRAAKKKTESPDTRHKVRKSHWTRSGYQPGSFHSSPVEEISQWLQETSRMI